MNKIKIFLTLWLAWIVCIGYLTWFNGLKKKGPYLGFNWEEWIWFGVLPATIPFLIYFIWKPEGFKSFINCLKSFFKS